MNLIMSQDEQKLASVTMPLRIQKGIAVAAFPESLLRLKLCETYIIPFAISLENETNKVCYLFSNASFYQESDGTHNPNLIQTFEIKKGLTRFENKMINAMNYSPTVIKFNCMELVNNEYKPLEEVEGYLTLQFMGIRRPINR